MEYMGSPDAVRRCRVCDATGGDVGHAAYCNVVTPKEPLKKLVIPAEPAPYRDTGAGIQGLKNRSQSNADWMRVLRAAASRLACLPRCTGMTPRVLLQRYPKEKPSYGR